MNDDEIYEATFAQFSNTYPHEAYQLNPELFWKQFQKREPGVSREQMIRILKETECAKE